MKYILQSVPLSIKLGAHADERLQEQMIWVTLEFSIKSPKACKTDNLSDCVDYEPLYNSIKSFGKGKEFHTLEFLHTEMKKELKKNLKEDFKLTILKKPFTDANVFVMDDTK